MGDRPPPMAETTIRPLTPDLWADFVRLFGERGVGGGCWCMFWRLGSRKEYEAGKGDGNREAMRRTVEEGPPPGLIAFDGGEPVGWCAVAPRDAYPALERSPSRRRIDDEPVWSVPCVYVARSHRGRGLSTALIEAACDWAAERGAKVIEGYPVPAKPGVSSTSYAFTGYEKTFARAGFREVVRRYPTRPVVRRAVGDGGRADGGGG